MTTIQEHLTSAWKTAERDTVTSNPARKETEDETKEGCIEAAVVPMIKGKPLALLQVNSSSINNKTLDFWNFDTYNLML